MKRYFLPKNASAYLDSLSGLTVALALIPEAIAFALVAHVSPLVGLFAAFFMCTVTALVGGRPGMISGATGSTAVVMIALVAQWGVEYLFAAVILGGVLQIIFAFCRIGKMLRYFSKSLMVGFVNGLALIVFFSQLNQFKIISHGVRHWLATSQLLIMLALVVVVIAIMVLMAKFVKKVPAALTAIAIVTFIAIVFGVDTRVVGDMLANGHLQAHFPSFSLPSIPVSWHSLFIVLPYALLISIVGLSETLITQRMIDERTQTQSSKLQECIGQGVANMVSGFFGAMGGCAMIGQSMINITSGARGRLSGIVAGVFLLVFVLELWPAIRMIPLAALVGVMMMVVYETMDWSTFRLVREVPKYDVFIVASVIVTTLAANLAVAVIVGIALSLIRFAPYLRKKLSIVVSVSKEGVASYTLNGPLYFVTAQHFIDYFKQSDDATIKSIVLNMGGTKILDHTGIDALAELKKMAHSKQLGFQMIKLSSACQKNVSRSAKRFLS